MTSYLEACRERVVIYDGAFGTYVQQCDLTADDFSSQFADLLQRFLLDGHAAGVVRAGDDDQPGARRDEVPQFLRINLVAVFKAARKPLHVRAQVNRRRQDRLVHRLLDQHFVAAFDDGCHRQKIRHRSPLRGDDLFGRHAILCGDQFHQRSIALMVRPVHRYVIERDCQIV